MTHKARKRFGQNFLQDHSIINNILSHAYPQAGEHWVEIGPGLGALTLPLLSSGVTLDLVELDRDLVTHLQKQFVGNPNLTIHSADALKFDFNALAKPNEKLRIIGNLPYNISSPILFHCITHLDVIEDMIFMLQKEVVDRMAAAPGSKVYGRLSVMLQLACRVEPLLPVPPQAFRPPPKVDSAVVRLTPLPREQRPVEQLESIARLVRAAFGQRRKTLSNSLDGLASADDLRAVDIDPRARAEQLSPPSFVRLAEFLGRQQAG